MRSAVVIGASFSGLLAAAALVKAGADVVVLERDHLPDPTTPQQPRSGVPQSAQPHILLRRGLLAIETLLPGIGDELLARGGVPFNTGRMPWLGEYGWMPLNDWAYEIISISRPSLEAAVRDRVVALTGVRIVDGARVDGLHRATGAWQVTLADGTAHEGEVVVDASGRGSRLPHWLTGLGVSVGEAETIEAKVGYATRCYRGGAEPRIGMVVAATPDTQMGALALPIEDSRWLVAAAGYGDHRPGRSEDEFDTFLRGLRDPAIADLVADLEPVGDVVVHRQTGNRRHDYGQRPDWPAGLFAVGDALCAFNPVFGQGITVAACQAELVARWVQRFGGSLGGAETRVLQRRIAAVTDLPWSVATGEDLRMPTSPGHPNRRQQLVNLWTTRMIKLAAGGDETCTRAFASVYHLMGSPTRLVSPPVVAAVARSMIMGVPPSAQRPAGLGIHAR